MFGDGRDAIPCLVVFFVLFVMHLSNGLFRLAQLILHANSHASAAPIELKRIQNATLLRSNWLGLGQKRRTRTWFGFGRGRRGKKARLLTGMLEFFTIHENVETTRPNWRSSSHQVRGGRIEAIVDSRRHACLVGEKGMTGGTHQPYLGHVLQRLLQRHALEKSIVLGFGRKARVGINVARLEHIVDCKGNEAHVAIFALHPPTYMTLAVQSKQVTLDLSKSGISSQSMA